MGRFDALVSFISTSQRGVRSHSFRVGESGPDLTGYGMSEFRDAPRMQFTLQASLSPLQDCIQAYTLRSQCSVDELRTLRSAS